MIKGYKSLLVTAIALAGISASHASAPVLQDLPDVIIGEKEDNIGTDNNYLVFTNAFQFDNYVSDAETPDKSQLKWSFDEDSYVPGPGGADSDARWFAINGKTALHAGPAEEAADGSTGAPHALPAVGNELRAAGPGATFRDIVFSPLAGSAPFPNITIGGAQQLRHAYGKVVRMFVSDSFNVVSQDIIVKSVADSTATGNGTPDSLSPAYIYTQKNGTTFAGSADSWEVLSAIGVTSAFNSAAGGNAQDGDTAGELRSTFTASTTGWRIGGMWTRTAGGSSTAFSLPYSAVGATNYVRAKFFLYSGAPTATDDESPGFRLRVTMRNAIIQFAEYSSTSNDSEVKAIAKDIRPSRQATRPSLYRLDFDPIDIPLASGQDIDRGYEVMAPVGTSGGGAEQTGFLALTESSIGVYPSSAIPETSPVKTYIAASNDFDAGAVVSSASASRYQRTTTGGYGAFISSGDAVGSPQAGISVSNSLSTGLTLSVNTAATEIGILADTIVLGNAADQGTAGAVNRIRLGENQLYKARYHVASTNPSSGQGMVGLKVSSLKFLHAESIQIGPSKAGGSVAALATQAAPGTGDSLPAADRRGVETNGGFYNVLYHSPMSKQIRPETAFAGQTIDQRMPAIAAQRAEGVGPDNNLRRRDISMGAFAFTGLINSDFGSGPYTNNDTVLFNIDEIKVYRVPAIADGHESYGL